MNFLATNFYWIIPALIFETVLKSMALWKAARHGQKYWFIGLIIVNSVGILPLLYIFFFQKENQNS